MNITQFTKSFDACVGHAKGTHVTEKWNGATIEYNEDADGTWHYIARKDGQTWFKANFKTAGEAQRIARALVTY